MKSSLKLLDGIRIVAFTQFLLGPAAVQYLADMGAEVIKVEHPTKGAFERHWSGGKTFPQGESMFFMLANRNARSVGLDLKDASDQDAARRLCQEADVVVTNFRPGVMERFGLGYEDFSQENERLIYASASGYGSDSPSRNLPGQDLLLQAITGLAAATGPKSGPPVPAGAAIVDQHAASLLAMGVLGALLARERTGKGQQVEVTMVEAALDLQTEPLLYHLNGGTMRRPEVPLGSGFHEAPYGVYPVRDGHIALSLSPLTAVSNALGGPTELAPYLNPDDAMAKREEIYRALSPLLTVFRKTEILELFREHDIWCAPINDYDEALADEAVAYLNPLQEIDHPRAGRVLLLRHPIRYGSGEATVRFLPPALAANTEEVLEEFGIKRNPLDQ